MIKRKKTATILKTASLLVFNLIAAILKTLLVSLFLNLKQGVTYSFHPEEKEKIKMKLSIDKNIKLINERLQRVERLLYSIFEDPEYTKRKEGKYDLKELKKEVQK